MSENEIEVVIVSSVVASCTLTVLSFATVVALRDCMDYWYAWPWYEEIASERV